MIRGLKVIVIWISAVLTIIAVASIADAAWQAFDQWRALL